MNSSWLITGIKRIFKRNSYVKEKTLFIDTSPIGINQLSENNDFQLDFDLRTEDFVGTLIIALDPDGIEWDTHDGEDLFPRSCNRLIVSVTTELEISEVQFLENAYFLVIEYLIIFFNYLQIELGQYWVDVGSIRDWDLLTFLDKTIARRTVMNREEKIRIPVGGFRKRIAFSPKRRSYPEKSSGLDVKQIPHIKDWFEQYKGVDLPKLLLATSKRSLLHSDYGSSSVLAITALEGPLESFVKERCKIMGLQRKGDSVGYNLSILPSILKTDELTDWLEEWLESYMNWHAGTFDSNQVIHWAVKLNRERNEAVHEGKTPDFETLDKGIFAVEAIYEFITANIPRQRRKATSTHHGV